MNNIFTGAPLMIESIEARPLLTALGLEVNFTTRHGRAVEYYNSEAEAVERINELTKYRTYYIGGLHI